MIVNVIFFRALPCEELPQYPPVVATPKVHMTPWYTSGFE